MQIKVFDGKGTKNFTQKSTAPVSGGGTIISDAIDLRLYIFGEDLIQYDRQERGWRHG